MKVNIIAPVLGYSGYAIHARNLGLALDKLGVDVGFETFIPDPNWQDQVTPELRRLILKDNRDAENQVMITPPPQAYTKSGQRKNIFQYAIFEGTQIPTSWKHALSQPWITEIIAPSKHTKQSITRAGVNKPISVIPHGVDTKIFNPTATPLLPKTKDEFRFVWCKGWAIGEKDRSGLEIFLRAFTTEFTEKDKVKAIVKINPSYANKDYNQAIRDLKLEGPHKKSIMANFEILPEKELAGIYTSGDVFVACSKGDAFDLPALEAMACGLPLIYSTHNGHEDFAHGWPIKKGKYITPGDPNPIYEEAKWWETDQKELQKTMREVYTVQNVTRNEGMVAKQRTENYTWENSAKNLTQTIEKTLNNTPTPPPRKPNPTQ